MEDPSREWVWHPAAQDYYMQHWDGSQWIMIWARRRDSIAESIAEPNSEEAGGLQADIPADAILGKPATGAFEALDPEYMIQPNPRRFFTTGRVFAILFTEPLGSTVRNGLDMDNISTVMYGEQVFTAIRRFVVVKEGRGFCYACPISTYGGRGTGKRGLNPSSHAIIYTTGSIPQYVSGESELQKSPIELLPANPSVTLTPASRINFAIHHPIQHNVKVKDLGVVRVEMIPDLIHYARYESGW